MSAPTPSLPERYTLVRHVADGGMAAVWEATDELLGRSVAVKVLAPALAADEDARRRFTREARAAARLSTHPHVVTVYDAGEHAGQTFLVMALYPGGTVADRLAQGPIPRAQALDWLEDAASALDSAHAEGVVHRDVKPANLLLDAHDHVAVGDFGIATAAWESAMTSTGLVLGTIAYLSPEQRTGGAATPASDRYALGLVARQLLTGAKPGAIPKPGHDLPAAATAVLTRATAEDPKARPASCAALVSELDEALAGGKTQATRVAPALSPAAARPRAEPTTVAPVAARTPRPAAAPPPPGPPPSRGRFGGKALAGLAALALLVGGAAVAFSAGGGEDPGSAPTTSDKKPATNAKSESTPATTTEEAPPAASPEEPAADPAPVTKSRAALIAQNDAAYAATKGDPAGQVAPLREAVDGLCTDESDVNCAFALFNLAQALRLSGQPAEAIPLLERRLSVSDNQVGAVRAELALAQQAAGTAAAPAPEAAPAPDATEKKGKAKGKEKDD